MMTESEERQTTNKYGRKIVQISAVASYGLVAIHALCNDGNLYVALPRETEWKKIPPIPQGE
jgi:hypothetical protein